MKKIILILLIAIPALLFSQGSTSSKEEIIREYYPDSAIKRETTYLNGAKEGVEKKYFSDGKIWMIAYNKNGEYNGSIQIYFENGQLESDGLAIDGRYNGKLKKYYSNGTLREEADMLMGKYNGYVSEYNESGKILSSRFWVNGKLSGTLEICDGVQILIKKLQGKEYDQLANSVWMSDNFSGIVNFEYSHFSAGSSIRYNQCVLYYLPISKDKDAIYASYEKIRSDLKKCEKFKPREETILLQGQDEIGKKTSYDYSKEISVEIFVNLYKFRIELRVYKTADKEQQ